MFSTRTVAFFLVSLSVASFHAVIGVGAPLQEKDRLAEYKARNHTWPPLPDEYLTEGWRKIFEQRFRQLDALDLEGNSYNGYMGAVHAGLLCKNFSEYGWGLTRAPQGLVEELQTSLQNGLAMGFDSLPIENEMLSSINTPNRPLFIHQRELNQRALQVIQPIAEAWSDTKLIGSMAYGLRIYRNESTLNMHIDRSETHVISAILHVGHDEDSEPWPLVIEGFDGATNEVTLESGDMLLYESSKAAHGRPKPFNGTWYSSLFIHYYPVDWDAERVRMDAHYRVPEIWNTKVPTDEKDLVVVDTSLIEPQCTYSWCAMKKTVTYSGPAKAYGQVMSAGGVIKVLDIPSEDEIVRIRDEREDGEL